jgi:hypothetical protein
MIPAAAITEWSNRVLWADPYFVEQDLVINPNITLQKCRSRNDLWGNCRTEH